MCIYVNYFSLLLGVLVYTKCTEKPTVGLRTVVCRGIKDEQLSNGDHNTVKEFLMWPLLRHLIARL